MVGVLDDQRARPAGDLGGQPPGELVGLGAGRREEDGVEPGRHRRHQSLGELDHLGVEVARVGVEPPQLTTDPLGDRRVGVADDRDVVVGVQVATTVGCDQPRPLPADEVERPVVEQRRDGAAHRLLASLPECHAVPGRGRPGPGEAVQPQRQRGRRQPRQLVRRPGVGVVVLRDVGRVVGVRGRPTARDDGAQGESRQHQLAEHLDLLGRQLTHALVAAERRTGELPRRADLGGAGVAQHGGERDGEVRDVGGVVHVAEVDDAGDRAVGREQVGQRDVGVVDPAGQRRDRAEACGHPPDDRVQRVVGGQAGRGRDGREGAYVPVERPTPGRGVEEAAERAGGACGRRADLLGEVLGDDLSLERCPGDGRDEPGQALAALVVDDRDDVGAVTGGYDARDR